MARATAWRLRRENRQSRLASAAPRRRKPTTSTRCSAISKGTPAPPEALRGQGCLPQLGQSSRVTVLPRSTTPAADASAKPPYRLREEPTHDTACDCSPRTQPRTATEAYADIAGSTWPIGRSCPPAALASTNRELASPIASLGRCPRQKSRRLALRAPQHQAGSRPSHLGRATHREANTMSWSSDSSAP
jgi:hypothetical protein